MDHKNALLLASFSVDLRAGLQTIEERRALFNLKNALLLASFTVHLRVGLLTIVETRALFNLKKRDFTGF